MIPGRIVQSISWLAVAVLPWPVLTGLAWWQLRRAERAETDEDAP